MWMCMGDDCTKVYVIASAGMNAFSCGEGMYGVDWA
jgi:hypothetical protein